MKNMQYYIETDLQLVFHLYKGLWELHYVVDQGETRAKNPIPPWRWSNLWCSNALSGWICSCL